MKILEALAIWRKVKPWLDKLKLRFPSFFAALKEAFKDPPGADTTPVLPPNHPDRKRKWPDDWNSDNSNG